VVDGEYAQTAYDLKESINEKAGEKALTVLVKFGESPTASGAGMTPVQFFPLPGPVLGLAIENAEYNTVTNEIEVTYVNTGNAPEYVKSQIRVFADGTFVGTVGDEEAFSIGRDSKAGVGYPIDIEEGGIIVNITSFFGSSRKSMESGIQTVMDAGRVEFVDDSELGITEFTEDYTTKDLHITYTNTGDVPVYFKADATVELNGTSTKIDDETVYELATGESRIIKFPGIAKAGSVITAGADYGEREAFLDKRAESSYEAVAEDPAGLEFDMNILYIVIIVILIVIAVYLFWSKNK